MIITEEGERARKIVVTSRLSLFIEDLLRKFADGIDGVLCQITEAHARFLLVVVVVVRVVVGVYRFHVESIG